MRALLDEPSVVEHEDAVGREDGREPMGDYERCAAGKQRPQGGLARERDLVERRPRAARVGEGDAVERDRAASAGQNERMRA